MYTTFSSWPWVCTPTREWCKVGSWSHIKWNVWAKRQWPVHWLLVRNFSKDKPSMVCVKYYHPTFCPVCLLIVIVTCREWHQKLYLSYRLPAIAWTTRGSIDPAKCSGGRYFPKTLVFKSLGCWYHQLTASTRDFLWLLVPFYQSTRLIQHAYASFILLCASHIDIQPPHRHLSFCFWPYVGQSWIPVRFAEL